MTGKYVLGLFVAIVVVGGVVWFTGKSDERSDLDPSNWGGAERAPAEDVPVSAPTGVETSPSVPRPSATQAPISEPAHTQESNPVQVADSKPAPAAEAKPTPPPAQAPVTVASAPVNVSIQSFAFSNATLNIAVGTKVTWTNNDSAPHTVTSDKGGIADGVFGSGTLSTGDSFSFSFDKPGTYTYHCKFHPGMTAKVIVQ